MLTQVYVFLALMAMNYFHAINAKPTPLSNIERQTKKLSEALMLEPFGVGSHRFINEHPDEDDNTDEDEILHEKRQSKTKWAKFYQGAPSPYTIAFPALIRSRRWVLQEQ